jgi:hypothetical protein
LHALFDWDGFQINRKGREKMYIRGMKKEQYELVKQYLATHAKLVENSISYDVPVTLNGIMYLVRMQRDTGWRIAILQVVKKSPFGDIELLRDNALLHALTEVFIKQIWNENRQNAK